MKRVIFGFAIISTFLVNAQTSSITYGAKAGLNVSSITKDGLLHDQKSTIGFNVGGFINIPISSQFSIQPELLYTTSGAKGKYTYEMNDFLLSQNPISIGTYKLERSFTLSRGYLAVPIMIQYKALPDLYVEAGPELGFMLTNERSKGDETISTKPDGNNIITTTTTNFDRSSIMRTNRFNLGIGIGAGYYFTRNIGINIRYVVGVTNIYKKEAQDNLLAIGKDNFGPNTVKNNTIQIGLAYKFK